MKTSNNCAVAFNPFSSNVVHIEHFIPYPLRDNMSNVSFFRKILNVFLIPFCSTQRMSIGKQLLDGVEHLDIGLSYYKGRWIITNGLYITPYTMEDVLHTITSTRFLYPHTLEYKIITFTLRLDYRFCPKRNVRVLFHNYLDKLKDDEVLITDVEYKWEKNTLGVYWQKVKQFIGGK